MSDNPDIEKFPKPPATTEYMEEEKRHRLEDLKAKSCEFVEKTDHFLITTVWN